MNIKIGNIKITRNSLPFVIGEVGINHNGEIKNALKMIDIAKNAGLNAIKFQTFKADEFISDKKLKYTYFSQGEKNTESMFEMFKRYELSNEDWKKIKKKCDEKKILFLSTPQNKSDLEILLDLGISAIKVGSDDFTNIPLIKEFTSTKLPLILSCGMANLSEIHTTLKLIGTFDGYPTILLHTTSQYPTPKIDTNLLKIKTLQKIFSDIPIGFSDHTKDPLASSIAVALGAVVFEKHFTLDNNLPGPDHWFSENPQSLKKWIDSIKDAFVLLGKPELEPTKEELKMKKIARRSIIASKNIKKNEKFTKKNLGFSRPGTGIEPSMYERILGLKSTREIRKNENIRFGDFVQ